jgi:hypothetical protein
MRICVQLGYHKAPSRPLDPVTEQRRRRLFWCCYVQERFASCGLGRPIAITDSDITVAVSVLKDTCKINIRQLINTDARLRSTR